MKRSGTSWLLFGACIGAVLVVPRAQAIPPHAHGTVPSQFTTWEFDGDRGQFESHGHVGVTTEAGDTYHQHYNDISFGGWLNRRDPWSSFGAWDDERFFADGTDPFDGPPYPNLPHGFIDEYAANTPNDRTIAGVSDHIPDYYFENAESWDPNALDMVEVAFQRWSALQAGTSPVSGLPLRTGLEFERTLVQANAEIIIRWQDIADLGLTARNAGWTGVGGTTLTFDSNPTGGWYFPENPANCPANQYHFFSTALHEVGHVLGLYEQNDADDVMVWQRGPGPNGPAFGAIDIDSRQGAYALYSIPVPEPAAIALLLVAITGMFARKARTR